MKIFILSLLFTLSFSFTLSAQDELPHTFTQTAQNVNNGEAMGLAIGTDGTIFLANGSDGLRAYTYDGISLQNIAHINNGGEAKALALSADSKIFVAYGTDGLRTYTFDGLKFTKIADINTDGDAGGGSFCTHGGGIAIGPDGTIFLPNGYGGLRAYSFVDDSLINTAHIYDSDEGSNARDIAVNSTGTIFLANNHNLQGFTYDGESFTNVAQVDSVSALSIGMGPDGKIFLFGSGFCPCAGGSMRVYNFDDTHFTCLYYDSMTPGVIADMVVGPKNTCFMAGGHYGGLQAYTYESDSLVLTALIRHTGDGYGVAIGKDGTIFLAGGGKGLSAYDYSGYSALTIESLIMPDEFKLFQNYPNPFNTKTVISWQLPVGSEVDLSIFNILGQKVATLVSRKQQAGHLEVKWDASGFASGVYYYRLQAGEYVDCKKLVLLK